MTIKAFIDTNIIIDLLQESRPFHRDAKDTFYNLSENLFSAYYSESIVTTLAYILRKEYTPNGFRLLIENLNANITILSCRNELVNITTKKDSDDFEDALLYEIALDHGMDYFVTSNKKDFKKILHPSLPVITSQELNQLISN